MAIPFQQALAESLQRVHAVARDGIVKTNQLLRQDRERLLKCGWLTPIVKGWYLLAQPDQQLSLSEGESTRWYTHFWHFLTVYLEDRFESAYCLSAADSLHQHLGITVVPKQILVMVKRGGSSVVELPFNTSLMIYQETKTFPEKHDIVNQLQVMSLVEALCRVPPIYFKNNPEEIQIALELVDINTLSRELLMLKNIAAAERILGAFGHMGKFDVVQQLQLLFQTAGYPIRVTNPFEKAALSLTFSTRVKSPYAARVRWMWEAFREPIIKLFPNSPGIPRAKKKYLTELDGLYQQDAYHSLSIEGYKVTKTLIDQIAKGDWNPDADNRHREQRDALAARGYYLAFQSVKESIEKILEKQSLLGVIKNDLPNWYRQLFLPGVQAGIISIDRLAGYRDHPVYIRGSMHVPFPERELLDAMDAFYECLNNETEASVRAVLGHFLFVYIHPFPDGNGRVARFLMNTMFASGGFPWTVIHVEERANYFKALEKASVDREIKPFAKFVLSEMVSKMPNE